LKDEKTFKVGETERVIYRKVNGLKTVDFALSAMYNFGKDGAFEFRPVGSIVPDLDASIKSAHACLLG
jgi:hypothetical protein